MTKENKIESVAAHLAEMYQDAGYFVTVNPIADEKGYVGTGVKVSRGDVAVVARVFEDKSVMCAEVRPTEECLSMATKQAAFRMALKGHPFATGLGALVGSVVGSVVSRPIALIPFSVVGHLICACMSKELSVKVNDLIFSIQNSLEGFGCLVCHKVDQRHSYTTAA